MHDNGKTQNSGFSDVRIAQNLQNMLHLVDKTDNTECHFFGGNLQFLKQIKLNLPKKNNTESGVGRCREAQNLQNLSIFLRFSEKFHRICRIFAEKILTLQKPQNGGDNTELAKK